MEKIVDVNTGKYIGKDGVIRYDYKKKYTKEQLKAQREDFEKEAQTGKMICISDLMCSHGL